MTAPRWAARLQQVARHASEDLLGGPRPWRFATVIDLQKGTTFLVLGACLWYYGANGAPAWTYLALHGSYGLIWLLKDVAFPDPKWQVRVTIAGGLAALLFVLGPYWGIGWLLLSGRVTPSYPLAEPIWLASCISLCVIGVALMIAADAQKFFTLRERKQLITDGVHRYIRHPNYLGEMMIYGSFALVVWHWIPAAILAWVWLGVFAPNMVMKEASLARYPEWAAYRARSWWLIPGVL
jgi:protein-S-isoprenylcysteine O-methyltransferase Ste14